MSKGILDQVDEELSVLTFARVSKIVLEDKHKEASHATEEASYRYYYGFAVIEKGKTTNEKDTKDDKKEVMRTVWFKNATHYSRNGGFFFGSVSHAPGYTKASDIPRRGEIIVGQLVESKKGYSYEYWTHHATPFMNFRAFLRAPRKLSNDPRAFSMLKLVHSRQKTTDDLYIMAQVLLKQNVSIMVSQLMAEGERVRHPWLKDESGYQRKRGFELEYHVVEIAYFLSLFVKQPSIYKNFLQELERKKKNVMDWPDAKLEEYSLERLEKNIEFKTRKEDEERRRGVL